MKLRQLKYNRVTVFFSWIRFLLLKRFYKKIIIGASGRGLRGYLKTEEKYFNVLSINHWSQVGDLESIVAEHVWEHLPHPEFATKMAYRYLSNGGELLLAVPDDSAEKGTPSKELGHFWCFSPISLRKLLQDAGFRKIKILIDDNRVREKKSYIIQGIK